MLVGITRAGLVALAAAFAAPALAQDIVLLDAAVTLAAVPPAFALDPPDSSADTPVNLLIAAHRTTAQRHSDSYLTSGKPRRRPGATSMRLRPHDDGEFSHSTAWHDP